VDMTAVTTGVADVLDATPTSVRSELLCFISSKADLMSFDDIVKICTGFYREDEILESRCLLEKAGVSMHKRKGPEKNRTTVEDITKVVLNPNTSLPTFYATDLNRLPPVDVKHCDISAILVELQALRTELRNMSHIHDDVLQLRNQVDELRHCQDEVIQLRSQVDELRHASVVHVKSDGVQYVNDSFASKATALQKSGMASRPPVREPERAKEKPRSSASRKTVIGASTTNKHVASVKTIRSVNIFVSRCHPHTANAMLTECVDGAKGDLEIHGVECTKLKSRFEHLYSSFYVQVRVASSDFQKAIDLLMSAEVWPSDLLVRRYYPPKNGED